MIVSDFMLNGCLLFTLLLGFVCLFFLAAVVWYAALKLWVKASMKFRRILRTESLIVDYKINKKEIDKYLVENGLVKK